MGENSSYCHHYLHPPLPRFLKKEYVLEVSEKAHVGDYLGIVEVESRLGVVFSLNVDSRRIPFAINPSTGTVSLDAPVDYEKSQSYNYTVFASSMVRLRGPSGLRDGCVFVGRGGVFCLSFLVFRIYEISFFCVCMCELK